MQKEIVRLKNNSEENLKVVVLLTQKIARKKVRITSLKKQIEHLKSKLSTHTTIVSELKQDMQIFKENNIKSVRFLRNQMNMITEQLKSWESIKLLFINPKEIQSFIKQREFFRGTVFPIGNEYLADNICKLQIILKEKTKLLKSLEKDSSSEEEKVLEELECPYKKNVGILEAQTEEFRGRVDVLERKEKLLNKMFTSNVI